MTFNNRSIKKHEKTSRSMQYRLMLGASVAVLLLATPALAGEGDVDGCSRIGSVINCTSGLHNADFGPYGVYAFEDVDLFTTTAVNATDLEGVSSSYGPLIEVRQSGDIAVTTSASNWAEPWLAEAGDAGTFTLTQVKNVAAGDANAPGEAEIEALFASLDTDSDGIITVDTVFRFFATEWIGDYLGHEAGVEQERVRLDHIRRALPDYISDADKDAFIASLDADDAGTVSVDSATAATTQFINDNFDLDAFVETETALLETSGPYEVMRVSSASGTVNINNGVDLASSGGGIKAGSDSGEVIVVNSGNINATDYGIKIRTEGDGSATITKFWRYHFWR